MLLTMKFLDPRPVDEELVWRVPFDQRGGC